MFSIGDKVKYIGSECDYRMDRIYVFTIVKIYKLGKVVRCQLHYTEGNCTYCKDCCISDIVKVVKKPVQLSIFD